MISLSYNGIIIEVFVLMRMLKLTNENKILKGKTKLEGLMGRGICFLQKEQMMDDAIARQPSAE